MIVAMADKAKAAAAIRAALLCLVIRNLFKYWFVHDDPHPIERVPREADRAVGLTNTKSGSPVRTNDPLEIRVAFQTTEGLSLVFENVMGDGRASR